MSRSRHAVAAALAVALVACGGPGVKEGPTLKELAKQKAPPPDKLKTEPTAAPEASPDSALENYKRIADLATDPETKAEANRRLADLQIQLDESSIADSDSETRQRDSIKRYEALLESRPTEAGNDRVLYQLARAHQNVGEWEQAADALRQLTELYPKSPYADDAHFRRAELLYRTKDYAAAASEYELVMAMGPTTPFFEPAQHKFGWTQYELGNFDKALAVFLPVLEKELPPGELTDPKAALAGVATGRRDFAAEALRVASLSFIKMGGGDELGKYLAQRGELRFYPLLYTSLGDQLLERKRYSDAAKTWVSFQKRYPNHALAPGFQARVIAAYQQGGFPDLVVKEKERFVDTYEPKAAYWLGRNPTPEITSELRQHMDDVARFYHARAQKAPETEVEARRADFMLASRWYHRFLEAFPRDKAAPEFSFLMAEALMEGGKTLAAAQQYQKTASAYPDSPRAGEAAYAAVLAFHRHADQVAVAARPDALRQAVSASLKFAEAYDDRPEAPAVLVRAAEDLYQLKDLPQAAKVATRALKSDKLAPELQLTAWSVVADAQAAQKKWPEAEEAYAAQLRLMPEDAKDRGKTVELLAAAIYKQGEDARAGEDLREAADHFLRVGRVTPAATIRASADYDAAAALIQLKDWNDAATVLEDFRRRHTAHPLLPDVDKKLAVVYQSGNRPELAAAVFSRIAARSGETSDTRQEAAWSAAVLTEQTSRDPMLIAETYKTYVQQFPLPLDRAMEAREKLAEAARGRGDTKRLEFWLQDIIAADAAAGKNRTDRSRFLAAKAALEFARQDAAEAHGVPLKLPLEKSIPKKKTEMEQAIAALTKAADYGFAEVTTAATYELGLLYQDFGRALMESSRPRGMSELELEQYNLLLEEQAFPFEEKAIAWHEANLKRVGQGVFDDWVSRSARALAQLAPGKYGKREQGDEVYSALR